jgi:tyrosinase
MSFFNTAALDPIFWLHHANLDRLWEVWRRGTPPRSNPTDRDWLRMQFELVDKTGARVTMKVRDVLEIEAQLHYTYSGLPAPAVARAAPAAAEEPQVTADDGVPAETVGAIDEPVVLEGAESATTSFALSPPSRPDRARVTAEAGSSTVALSVEDIEGEANPGLLYGVYLNLPAGEPADPESPHYVGTLSFFGIESVVPDEEDEEAPHRLHYVFDVTDTVTELTSREQWNPDELHVTFAPIGVGPDTELEREPPPVRIGRVSLLVE